jgi:hypothetical protein
MPLFVMTEGSVGSGADLVRSSPGLCVEYIPHQTPNRLWRTDVDRSATWAVLRSTASSI